ncbi:MAG TPA: DUF502 domain-containing protein [bacterium]|jgi:uncharacterized membrane protein
MTPPDENTEQTPGFYPDLAKRPLHFDIAWLKTYLTTGLFVLLPFLAAIWVIVAISRWISGVFVQPIIGTGILNAIFEDPEQVPFYFEILVGIIAIFAALTLLTALGMLATNVVGKWFLGWVDKFFVSVPLASNVYNFVKGLIENFNLAGSGKFEEVVVIEYPKSGIWSVGFISSKVSGAIKVALPGERIAVFVPTGPNPTSGFIVLVEPSDIIHLDMSPEEALKFIVSGGVLMPGASTQKPAAPI